MTAAVAVPVVVDGYNLLYARGESPSPASRNRLVRDLVRWATRRRRRVLLVFDAWAQGLREPHEEPHGPVTVCFTRYGERADQHIVRWIDRQRDAVVVTSDGAVQQGVRRRGAAVVDAEAFAEMLESGDRADDPEEGDARGSGSPRARGRQARWIRQLGEP